MRTSSVETNVTTIDYTYKLDKDGYPVEVTVTKVVGNMAAISRVFTISYMDIK